MPDIRVSNAPALSLPPNKKTHKKMTSQISYVGYEHVDHDTVSDAIAGQTLFIHGSRVDEGNGASITATSSARNENKKKKKNGSKKTKTAGGVSSSSLPAGGQAAAETQWRRRQRRWRRLSGDDQEQPRRDDERSPRARALEAECSSACGSEEALAGLPAGTSTVCDPTCAAGREGGPRFDGFLCGAGDSGVFGDTCRLCYLFEHQARKAERALRSSSPAAAAAAAGGVDGRAVIMCDTMEPPEPEERGSAAVVDVVTGCSNECSRHASTVSRAPQKKHAARF